MPVSSTLDTNICNKRTQCIEHLYDARRTRRAEHHAVSSSMREAKSASGSGSSTSSSTNPRASGT